MDTDDDTYYTFNWNDEPVTVVSLTYSDTGLNGIYTMTFSNGSILTVSGELGSHGGEDMCIPVTFFKWNELFPSYTEDACNSASTRIDDVANEYAQISTFLVRQDTTTGYSNLCDTTLYINTDSDVIPYFGFRSTHNGCYSHEINICYKSDSNKVIYEKRIFL